MCMSFPTTMSKDNWPQCLFSKENTTYMYKQSINTSQESSLLLTVPNLVIYFVKFIQQNLCFCAHIYVKIKQKSSFYDQCTYIVGIRLQYNRNLIILDFHYTVKGKYICKIPVSPFLESLPKVTFLPIKLIYL